MSIVDLEKTANYISSWIKDYATSRGIQTLVLGLSGGVDSALVALLCKRTNLPLLCVNMPCHSSFSAFDRAFAFADDYAIRILKVDLSEAHNVIYEQVKAKAPPNGVSNVNGPTHPIAVGGMRSCLRPTVLNFFTNAYRGVIVGTGNRSEDNITRYFQKYGDGCVDISPIADLFKAEIYELFKYLAVTTYGQMGKVMPMGPDGGMPASAKDIYDAKPTADLWGPDAGQEDEKELGISYDEIEWADREDMRTTITGMNGDWAGCEGIIFNDTDPAKRPDFFRYTGRQQQVIAKLHAMEKASRHKMNPNLPVCRVRSVPGLVR